MERILLLVDDEAAILDALLRAFRRSGYRIITVKDGDAALKTLKKHPVAVVLSDHRMPRMTGTELMAQIKRDYPDTVRMLLSGYADLDTVMAAINTGAVYKFLEKPFNDDELRAQVADAFSLLEEQCRLKAWGVLAENSPELLPELTALAEAGLLNGKQLAEYIDHRPAGQGCPEAALYAIDIHHFSRIKECFGAESADRLLQVVAAKVLAQLGGEDRLAYLGRDHFLIYRARPLTGRQGHPEILSLLEPFDRLIQWDDEACYLRFNSAYLMLSALEDGARELMHNVRLALRHAKVSDRSDCPHFQDEMRCLNRTQLALQSSLCRALERDELRVFYQSKVDLATGTITGAEALLRWNHRSLGMISPTVFIPEAEDSGLINPIGDWVLHEAVGQALSWQQQGLANIRLAVNLSAVQLQQPGIVADIRKLLETAGLAPEYLELEITESVLPQDINQFRTRLTQLKNMGCSLAIDDFGTGYASFNYLRELPVDVLKIDRSFVSGIDESQNRYRLVRNMISMGHDLGMKVVAEGVENPLQLERLQQAGCDSGQGFLFSVPVSAGEFAGQLERGAVDLAALRKVAGSLITEDQG